MIFAIIGGGSIGTRHAQNLKTLGYDDVTIIEPDADQQEWLRALGFDDVEGDIERAFAPDINAVLICSPSIYHLEQAHMALRHEKSIFVEKPLAISMEGVDDLVMAAEESGLTTMVGFNMRFRDGFLRVKSLLENGDIGKPLAARANASFYLPHYHPDKDYRTRYQAQKKLGGGVVLDDIHELDYLSALFGPVTKVFAAVERLSDLEIDVEDYAAITLWHQSGVITQLQLDFLQHVYRRGLEVTGSKATLTLDHNTGEIRIYGPTRHSYRVFPQEMSVELNQMYLTEIRHFVDCLAGRDKPLADFSAGRDALRVAMAIYESGQRGEVIHL